ncbi:Uncharacterised protein [Bordetella pertussis]|nr:Uncharacterised protein [Bordetella pertussis]
MGPSLAAGLQQAQHRVRGALAPAQRMGAARQVAPRQLIAGLDQDGKADRRVQIALGHVETQAFCDQAEPDHQQQAQAQDHHGRMASHEGHQRPAGHHHHDHRHHHGGHHDAQVLHHVHGGNHRIEREHCVQRHDLHDHLPERGVLRTPAAARVRVALDAFVQLHGALEQQEQPAQDEDQVAAGYLRAPHREQRRGQRHHPGDAGQQAQPHQQGQRQAYHARAVALVRGQLVGQDGDEHQVVDAQHDLQHDQGRQPQPGGGVGHPFERHRHSLRVNGARRGMPRRVIENGETSGWAGARAGPGLDGGSSVMGDMTPGMAI